MKEMIMRVSINQADHKVYLDMNTKICEIIKGGWIVDWGDDCIEVNTSKHLYKETGDYTISIRGETESLKEYKRYRLITLDYVKGEIERGIYSNKVINYVVSID